MIFYKLTGKHRRDPLSAPEGTGDKAGQTVKFYDIVHLRPGHMKPPQHKPNGDLPVIISKGGEDEPKFIIRPESNISAGGLS